jgi:uncharacterized delta-60 repeat protein
MQGLTCALASSRNRGIGSLRGRWIPVLPPRDSGRIARRSVAIASGLLLIAFSPAAWAADVIETQISSSTPGSLLTGRARSLEQVSTNDPSLASEPELEALNATVSYAPGSAGQMAGAGLDPSFSNDGWVILNHQGGFGAVAIDAQNRILAAGKDGAGLVTARFLSDGTLDPTYGGGDGVATTTIGFSPVGITIEDGGTALLAGAVSDDFGLIRLTSTGDPDLTSFGGDGISTAPNGGADYANAAVFASGEVFVVGLAYGTSEVEIVHFLSNGTPDPAFGSGGISLQTFGGSSDGAGVSLDASGSIVVVGYCCQDSTTQLGVMRLDPTGGLDPTFSGDGVFMAAFPGFVRSGGNDVLVMPSGRIIVGGVAWNDSTADTTIKLMAFTTTGTVDTAFGANGIATGSLVARGGIADVVRGPSGSIMLFGTGQHPGTDELFLERFTNSGAPDPQFPPAFVFLYVDQFTNISLDSTGAGIIMEDGRLLVVGTSDPRTLFQPVGISRLMVARFKAPPPPCTKVGTGGPDKLVGGPGNDVLCGMNGDDVLIGKGGNDILIGSGGNDVIYPGPGIDSVDGGDGRDDLVSYNDGSTAVHVDLARGEATGGGADSLRRIEDVWGTSGADVVRGSRVANHLSGGLGADKLSGLAGTDALFGGRDNDRLDGGKGVDFCRQGPGTGRSISCER